MQTRASKVWLPGRRDQSRVSWVHQAQLNLVLNIFPSVTNSATHLERGKKSGDLYLKAFRGLSDTQLCFLIVCQEEASPGGRGSHGHLPSLLSRDRQDMQLHESLLYVIISSLQQNLIMIWHVVKFIFPGGKGAGKLNFQIIGNIDGINLCQELLAFYPIALQS